MIDDSASNFFHKNGYLFTQCYYLFMIMPIKNVDIKFSTHDSIPISLSSGTLRKKIGKPNNIIR
jgi:hypothetical protein